MRRAWLIAFGRTSLRIIGTPRRGSLAKTLPHLRRIDEAAVGHLFKRMPDDGAGLVVLDLDRARPVLAAVIRPSQISGQDVFRPLQPFEADHCRCGSLGLAMLNAAPREGIDLIPRDRGFGPFRSALLGDAFPGVRNIPVELMWMQAVNDAPCPPAQSNGLLALPRPRAPRAVANDVVDLVGADR